MNREYPDRPFIGVGAVIIDNARVLLVKRGHEPLTGEWSIPGGVLELGETVRQGVAREALEETGLIVEPLELLRAFDRVVRDLDERTLYHNAPNNSSGSTISPVSSSASRATPW